jgi:tetratricopeptide (TPR) repeat protein
VGRIVVSAIVFVLLVAPVLWFGRATLAWATRRLAQVRVHEGAISAAQEWLAWSARLHPGSGATDVIRAACFRRLGQQDRGTAALQLAEQKGAPASQVQQETRLGRIQDGTFDEGIEGELAALIKAGVPPNDLYAALVNGYLAKKDPKRAKTALEAWEARHPHEAHLAYAWGGYWLWLGKRERDLGQRQDFMERAERAFEEALAKQPRHELARVALAGLLEDQSRLEEALRQYAALAACAPANETTQLRLAAILRALNRLDQARRVLASLPPQSQASVEFAVEMAEIDLEAGNCQEADRWFARARVDAPDRGGIVGDAAVSAAIQEKTTRAQELFARIDAAHSYNVRMEDLVARLTTGADDPQAEDELRRLAASRPGERAPGTGQTAADRQEGPEATAAGLYALHCSGCHGENGDGHGRAGRHLFPKPRDLRTGKARLVSTVNGVPSLEDLEAVIRRGMPGTAMRAFDRLNEDQRMLLAQEVRRLNRLGIGEHFIDTLVKAGEKVDEREVREVIKLGTTPADTARVPRIGLADPPAIARGKDAYIKLGCYNCHGADGAGGGDLPLFDEKGRPAPPRDLVHDAFKGGPEPESLYLRILLGMPGTPHPGCPGVAAEQLIDLVHYCRSLSREPKREWSNHQRALQAWTPPSR